MGRYLWLMVGVIGLPGGVEQLPGAPVEMACVDCHRTQAEEIAESVHSHAGFACQECHGGAAQYTVESGWLDRDRRADPAAASFDHGTSFLGKPARREIPERCGECHAEIERMNPYGLPADQLARYRVSAHGKALFGRGDERVAVCTDCHGTHRVFAASDPRSGTHPLKVPDTCGGCHGDEALMSAVKVPTEVIAEYRSSVHGVGLLERHDTGMPTCATCHDNHGAAPPGFGSVDAVCGRCHQAADEHFLASPHASVTTFPRCLACHGGDHGHAISRVTRKPEEMLEEYLALESRARASSIDRIHPQLALIVQSCQNCHEEPDDEAELPASPLGLSQRLHDLLVDSELAYLETAAEVDRVGRGVLLVDAQHLRLSDARSELIRLQALQHMLDPGKIGEAQQTVKSTCDEIRADLSEMERGLRLRYWVLVPMWAFLLTFVGAMYYNYRLLRVQWGCDT